jgi:uncharacterized protein (TIGR00290 family)
MEKIVLSWSGGKDSALALHRIRKERKHQVISLLTTYTEGYERVSMHGVRRPLLRRQAEEVELPLLEVPIPKDCTDEDYKSRMKRIHHDLKEIGVAKVAFGDIFLEDVRRYREANLDKVGMTGDFPLWGSGTKELAREFVALGFKAILTCVDTEQLDGGFAGRVIDDELLDDLPSKVDPMGENGEYHTFVYDGPIYKSKVKFEVGEKVLRDDRFLYCDLLPKD